MLCIKYLVLFSFQECFKFALPGIGHAVDLLKDDTSQVKQTHTELQSTGDHHCSSAQEKVSDLFDCYSVQLLHVVDLYCCHVRNNLLLF